MKKTIKINESKKSSLSQQAYIEIRNRIFNNDIKPGDLINESAIAKELGISRTPIREALRMLASEDVIEIRDGIGTFVKMLSFKNIKDIFEVRKALEVMAVKSSIYNITDGDIEELENDFKNITKKYEMGILKKEEFTTLDMKVHQLIFSKCENNYVKNIFNEIDLKIKQYVYVSYENLNDCDESISQHLEILKLLKNKEVDELVVFLGNHIDWSLKSLLM